MKEIYILEERISHVMVSLLTSSVVDQGFDCNAVKQQPIKLASTASRY